MLYRWVLNLMTRLGRFSNPVYQGRLFIYDQNCIVLKIWFENFIPPYYYYFLNEEKRINSFHLLIVPYHPRSFLKSYIVWFESNQPPFTSLRGYKYEIFQREIHTIRYFPCREFNNTSWHTATETSFEATPWQRVILTDLSAAIFVARYRNAITERESMWRVFFPNIIHTKYFTVINLSREFIWSKISFNVPYFPLGTPHHTY